MRTMAALAKCAESFSKVSDEFCTDVKTNARAVEKIYNILCERLGDRFFLLRSSQLWAIQCQSNITYPDDFPISTKI